MPKSARTCERCQVTFLADNREIKRGGARYCSLSCSGKRPKPRKNLEYANLTCAQCNVSFKRAPSKLVNSKSGLYFCSRACKDQAQRIGGIPEIMPPHYGTALPDYSFARTSACQRCGYDRHPEILHVHHIDRDRTNNDSSNLVCLCPTCHDEDHWNEHTGRFTSWR